MEEYVGGISFGWTLIHGPVHLVASVLNELATDWSLILVSGSSVTLVQQSFLRKPNKCHAVDKRGKKKKGGGGLDADEENEGQAGGS